MNSSAPKILFITSSRIGDAVLSSGLLSHIEQNYPSAKVTIACAPLVSSLFEGYPLLERIIPLKKQSYNRHWIKLWRAVIGTKWDMVIDLRDSAVSRLIRADKRYIFSKQIDKSKHKIEQNAQLMELSPAPASKLWFSQEQKATAKTLIPDAQGTKSAATGKDKQEASLPERQNGKDKNSASRSERPYGNFIIGVGPTANWIGKTWPAERYIEILNWLMAELENGNLELPKTRGESVGTTVRENETRGESACKAVRENKQEASRSERPNGKDKNSASRSEQPYGNIKIAIFGAPGEEDIAYEVYNAMPEDRRLDIIAKGNPGTAAATIARCDLYIGNDSGLMHCAAAARVPTIGLFGPSYPHIYAPWGEHTTYARTPESFDELIDFKGYHPDTCGCLMETLTTDMVKDTITSFLKNLTK